MKDKILFIMIVILLIFILISSSIYIDSETKKALSSGENMIISESGESKNE